MRAPALSAMRTERMMLAVAVTCIAFGALDAARGFARTSAINVALGLLCLVAWRLPRLGLERLAMNLVLTAGIATIVGVSLLTGQRDSPVVLYFVCVPMFAAYVHGVRAAVAWTVVGCAAYLFVFLSPNFFLVRPDVIYGQVEHLLRVFGIGGLTLALTLGTRKAADIAVAELEARERTILAQAERLAEQKAEIEAARDDALSAARTKATFLANVSHELRTPLHAVIGLSGLLRETELSPEQRSYADTIEIGGKQLLSLIDDLLSFSKLEAGKLETETRPTAVRDLVEEAVGTVSPLAAEQGIELVAEIARDVPTTVLLDPLRVRQVLVNLLSNAVKFGRGEGETRAVVAVRVGVSTRSARSADLRFSVVDEGPGIPPEKQAKLFLPFSQIEASTSREHGGTGLGLAISRGLAEAMGGSIELESELGRGSTFTLALPAAYLPDEAEKAPLRGVTLFVEAGGATGAMLRQLVAEAGGAVTEDVGRADVVLAYATFDAGSKPRVVLLPLGQKPSPLDVSLSLPARRAALHDAVLRAVGGSASRVTPARAGKWTDAKRVLVVDDSAVNLRVADAMLRRLGHECTLVEDGESALRVAEGAAFDVAIVDLHLPGIDGVETARRLRQMYPASTLRLVGLSASVAAEDRARALAAGMDSFLTKPATLETLAATVGRAAAREEVLDEATVRQLRAIDPDGSLFRDLVETHRRERAACVEAIDDAVKRRDLDAARRAAHKLKGSAALLGAKALASAAGSIEGLDAPEEIPGALGRIVREVGAVDDALGRELARR